MAKMYLTEEETCRALGVDMDGLMELVNSRRLQMYQDGAKHVYKASDVEELAGEVNPGDSTAADLVSLSEDSTIGLMDDSGAGLEESDAGLDVPPPSMKKEDTVITAEGISIFDDEDLEIEEADPMAETQIAPSLDDQIALDGVGSGSGLLDLTRESDDTSLGAEVLDHIDMEGSTIGSTIGSAIGTGLSGGLGSTIGSGLADSGTGTGLDTISTVAPAPVQAATFVEAVDPSSGFFGGLLVGATIMMLLASVAAISAMFDTVSGLLESLQSKMVIVLVIMVVVTLVSGVIGLLLGKAFQTQQESLQ
ncbi:MAG: helix-turn-helix domain-containing protein [Phycisphaerae bacterium]|nr:helix-turn-helix domain-containing protein [Phycisphaerae bacterium]